MRFRIVLMVMVALTGSVGFAAQTVFDLPALFPQHVRYLSQFTAALRQGDWLTAETAARAASKLLPGDANWQYNVACVCARSGAVEEALKALRKALELGFSGAAQLEKDEDLAALRGLPAFRELVAQAAQLAANAPENPLVAQAQPTPIRMGGEASVTEANTQWAWDPSSGGYLTTLFALFSPSSSESSEYRGPYAEIVRPWLVPNALAGVLYVNRDADACVVRYENFPGLTPVVYSEEAQRAKAHIGAANGLFSNGRTPLPTVGNSTSVKGNSFFWRSIGRSVSSSPDAMATAFRLAVNNQLYVYDATADFLPGEAPGAGDNFHTYNPAFLLSVDADAADLKQAHPKAVQRGLTELVLAAVAVMPPETRQAMWAQGLFVPTVQRLFRQHVKGFPDYFSSGAHPVAFDPEQLEVEALLQAAHTLRPEQLPPAIRLAVRQDSMPIRYVDYFDLTTSEGVADTPVCVTRILRGRGRTRRLTVEVAPLREEPGMTFRWFVVTGQAEHVRIRPLVASGSLVTLEVDAPGDFMQSGVRRRRVDVACVAVRPDGVVSAPVFVSFRALGNERRVYDAQGRIQTMDYLMPEDRLYEDPVLSISKRWRDDYLYAPDGTCKGWNRTRPDGSVQRFDRLGRRVVEQTAEGAPKRVVPVRYAPRTVPRQTTDGRTVQVLELIQIDAGEPVDVNGERERL